MSILINKEGHGGAIATYHRVSEIKITKDGDSKIRFNLIGHISEAERKGKGRSVTDEIFNKTITQEQFNQIEEILGIYDHVMALPEYQSGTQG